MMMMIIFFLEIKNNRKQIGLKTKKRDNFKKNTNEK